MKNFTFKLVCCLWLFASFSVLKANSDVDTITQDKIYEQLLATRFLSNIDLSPNDKHLLLTYTKPQLSSNTEGTTSQWSNLFIIKNNYKSKDSIKVELPNDKVSALPSWIPNTEKISYLGQGDKFTSLWTTSSQEFKPQKILELESNIVAYKWSPNGKKAAILVEVSLPRNPIKLVYGVDKAYSHALYVVEFNERKEVVDRAPVPLENASFIAVENFSWTPDSESLIVGHTSSSEAGKSSSQLARIDVKTNKVTSLTKGEEMSPFPHVSPDGKWVAYVTTNFPGHVQSPIALLGMDAARVCLINLQNNERQCLAKTPNENPYLVGWKKDGSSLFAVDREGNINQIYELTLDGKETHKFVPSEQSVQAAHINPSGTTISYIAGDLKTPEEGYITSTDNFTPEKIVSSSFLNREVDFLVEQIQWRSQDKKFDVEGTVLYPKQAPQGKAFPLLTILNDETDKPIGASYVGNLSGYPISLLSLLKKGYAIFIPNRRGTDGCGVEFRQAIYKNIGGEDFNDVMGGIEALIQKQKVDPTRLALWGWGYGGYLSAWALTQTDRFKTIIVGAGIANLISQLGTTNSPAFLEATMGGPFWRDWTFWRERSPISHLKP